MAFNIAFFDVDNLLRHGRHGNDKMQLIRFSRFRLRDCSIIIVLLLLLLGRPRLVV
jgi:hypothetical protein